MASFPADSDLVDGSRHWMTKADVLRAEFTWKDGVWRHPYTLQVNGAPLDTFSSAAIQGFGWIYEGDA